MTTPRQDQAAATDRLRRALLAFQDAQRLLLFAHRRMKSLPSEEVSAFWLQDGASLERQVQTAAVGAVLAFKAFSTAGLVARAEDRRSITEAERRIAEQA
jgi:hypothetical protein